MRGVFLWLMVAVVLGGIVHIAAMLVIPTLAPQSAFSRFESTMQPNLARVLAPAGAGQAPFPFASPDAVYVLCRYDVTNTPVRLVAPTSHLYWSVGIYEPDGGNYFHINSVQSTSENTDILLLGRNHEADLGDAVTIARATYPRGLMILRIFLRDRTMIHSIRTQAEDARCSAYVPEEPAEDIENAPQIDGPKKKPADTASTN